MQRLGLQPTGVVAFLFSDVEGSTSLLQRVGQDAYIELIEQHHAVLRGEIARFRGWEFATAGDSFCVAFASASDAVGCAMSVQAAIGRAKWTQPVRVRVGLHLGEVAVAGDNYVGLAVHVAARIAAAAWGGQTLLSEAVARAVQWGEGAACHELGEFDLKDVGPQRLFELRWPETIAFPPPRAVARARVRLPAAATTLVGRDGAIAETLGALRAHRLVTLLGPGGVGKTRLALACAAEVADEFTGVWWVDLTKAEIDTDEAVIDVMARAVAPDDFDADATGAARAALDAALAREAPALMVLDNCEHVARSAARVASELLAQQPGLTIAATSRSALGSGAEFVYRVPGLPTPPEGGELSREQLLAYASVDLFCQRAGSGFGDSAPREVLDDVASLVRRVGGLPLAIELAAARAASFTVADIGEQLSRSLRFLRNPDAAVDPRQATLEGALDWSWNLLGDVPRVVLRRLAAVQGGISLEIAAAVCGDAVTDRAGLADVIDELCGQSLLARDTALGFTVWRFHPLVRAYAWAQLMAVGETDECAQRIARWVVEFAAENEAAIESWDRDAVSYKLDVHRSDVVSSLDRLAEDDPDACAVTVSRLTAWLRDRGDGLSVGSWFDRCRDRVGTTRGLAAVEGHDLARAISAQAMLDAREFAGVVPDVEATAARFMTAGETSFGLWLRGFAAISRAEPDVSTVEQILDSLDGTQSWVDLAFKASRTAKLPPSFRQRLRATLVDLGERYRHPAQFMYPDAAAGYAEEGRTDDAVACLLRGLAVAAPAPSWDHWCLHTSLAAVLVLADRASEAVPSLEELTLVPDSVDATGSAGRARALLATIAGAPTLPPEHRHQGMFGWALDYAIADGFLAANDVVNAARVGLGWRVPMGSMFLLWARLAAAVGDEQLCRRLRGREDAAARRHAGDRRHHRIEERWWEEVAAVDGAQPEPDDTNPLLTLDRQTLWKSAVAYLEEITRG